MENFKLGFVDKGNPMNLDKEKQRFIKRFRTNNFGLNRILEWKK